MKKQNDITKRGYKNKYCHTGKEIIPVGIRFSSAKKRIDDKLIK
jgi:hypothetical protein